MAIAAGKPFTQQDYTRQNGDSTLSNMSHSSAQRHQQQQAFQPPNQQQQQMVQQQPGQQIQQQSIQQQQMAAPAPVQMQHQSIQQQQQLVATPVAQMQQPSPNGQQMHQQPPNAQRILPPPNDQQQQQPIQQHQPMQQQQQPMQQQGQFGLPNGQQQPMQQQIQFAPPNGQQQQPPMQQQPSMQQTAQFQQAITAPNGAAPNGHHQHQPIQQQQLTAFPAQQQQQVMNGQNSIVYQQMQPQYINGAVAGTLQQVPVKLEKSDDRKKEGRTSRGSDTDRSQAGYGSLTLETNVMQEYDMLSGEKLDAIVGYTMDSMEIRKAQYEEQTDCDLRLLELLGIDPLKSYPSRHKSKPGCYSATEKEFSALPWTERRAYYRANLSAEENRTINPKSAKKQKYDDKESSKQGKKQRK
ncbi:MAG: hypothetical protein SGILL_000981 [Bacillariaceae sp.]